MRENIPLTQEVSEEGKKSWCSRYCLVQGSGRRHCWRDSGSDSCGLFLIHRTPPSPGIWHQGKDSHKQLEDTHEYHSPSPRDSRHSVIPSRGRTADAPGGYTVCAPHPGTGFLGRVALNSAEGYRHCNLSVNSNQSQSSSHKPSKASAILSLEPGRAEIVRPPKSALLVSPMPIK